MNYVSVTFDYALWWYSGGLKRLFQWISALFGWVANYFSVGRVLKTLFAPWKRLAGMRRPGLDGFRDWIVDNLVSRSVGLVVRLCVILIYLLAMFGLALFALAAILFWVLFPALIILSLVMIFIK